MVFRVLMFFFFSILVLCFFVWMDFFLFSRSSCIFLTLVRSFVFIAFILRTDLRRKNKLWNFQWWTHNIISLDDPLYSVYCSTLVDSCIFIHSFFIYINIVFVFVFLASDFFVFLSSALDDIKNTTLWWYRARSCVLFSSSFLFLFSYFSFLFVYFELQQRI